MRVSRQDRGEIGALVRTDAGAARVRARLTRVGVQQYQGADGKWHGELRPVEEVFAPESMASLKACTLTRLHPPQFVSTKNWRELSIGHAGEDVAPDGRWLAATLTIADGAAVADAEAKRLCEVSCGYEADLEHAPGVYLGTPYTYVQRRIRYNHVALGPEGWARAGRDARLLLDSSSETTPRARAVRFDQGQQMARFKQIEITDDRRIRFDGKDYDPSVNEQARSVRDAVFSHVRSAVPRADQLQPEQVQPLLDELTGHVSGLSETVMRLSEMVAMSAEVPEGLEEAEEMLGAETLDALAEARSSLVARAKRLAPNVETKGKSSAQIRRAVVDSINPAVAKDASDDVVRGAFLAIAVPTFSPDDRQTVDSGGPSNDDPVAEAQRKRRLAQATRWKRTPASQA